MIRTALLLIFGRLWKPTIAERSRTSSLPSQIGRRRGNFLGLSVMCLLQNGFVSSNRIEILQLPLTELFPIYATFPSFPLLPLLLASTQILLKGGLANGLEISRRKNHSGRSQQVGPAMAGGRTGGCQARARCVAVFRSGNGPVLPEARHSRSLLSTIARRNEDPGRKLRPGAA